MRRLLPLSGIAFVALVALSLGIGGGTPEPGDFGADVVSFYDDNEVRLDAATSGDRSPEAARP